MKLKWKPVSIIIIIILVFMIGVQGMIINDVEGRLLGAELTLSITESTLFFTETQLSISETALRVCQEAN